MNLEQFLEKENESFDEFYNDVDWEDYGMNDYLNWLNKHDTCLINFVLDIVKAKVQAYSITCENLSLDGGVELSTIIDNLKIK